MSKNLYFDYASATPLDREVEGVYLAALRDNWANASATHQMGQKARQALENARLDISKMLNCKSSELVFTSSASESNNLAIQGIESSYHESTGKAPHIIFSGLEHASVYDILKRLEPQVLSTQISENVLGIISLPAILSAIRPETRLISLMLVNNEIGTLQPVVDLAAELSGINKIREAENLPQIFLHTDAAQAGQYLQLDLAKIGVDMLTLSGQKIYAPKGNAILFIKNGTPVKPMIFGGGQEHGMRSGTPNVPGIVALAAALRKGELIREDESDRLKSLRDGFIRKIQTQMPQIKINGFWAGFESDERLMGEIEWIQKTHHLFGDLRITNNINLIIPNIDQQQLLTFLDMRGVYLSSGSSCASGSNTVSRVVKLVTNRSEEADVNLSANQAILRITLGRETEESDLDELLEILKIATQRLT